jgi:tetratricopeptide (TPR) repeat protein
MHTKAHQDPPERPLGRPAVAALLAVLISAPAGGCLFSRAGGRSAAAQSSRQWSQQAAAAIESGHWQQAESLLQQAIEANPDDPVARARLAQTLWKRGQRQAALDEMHAARQLAPHDLGLALQAGQLFLESGELERARQAAEEALDRDPRSAQAWQLRGRAWQASGEPARALADLQHGLHYAPNDRESLRQVAEVYRTLNQPQRTLSTLQALVATYAPREEPPEIWRLQGLAYRDLGRYDDAAERLRLASAHDPSDPELLCTLAETELAAGHPERAHDAALRALSIDPSRAAARRLVEQVVSRAPATTDLRR